MMMVYYTLIIVVQMSCQIKQLTDERSELVDCLEVTILSLEFSVCEHFLHECFTNYTYSGWPLIWKTWKTWKSQGI